MHENNKSIRKLHTAVSLVVVSAILVGIFCTGFLSSSVFAADMTIGLGRGTPTPGIEFNVPPSYLDPVGIADCYGDLWGTVDEVDIFRVSYENDSHEISVAGKNNEKVIAPGTENVYSFAVKNLHSGHLDYKLIAEAYFTGPDGVSFTIPVEAKLMGKDGWLLGDDSTYRPVLELNGIEESASLHPKHHNMYTLYWRWPFESDLNGDGNFDDGDALDTWLGTQSEDLALTIRLSCIASYHYKDDPIVNYPVPSVLNGKEHVAYLYGDDNGLIRPEANITRAEVAAIIFRLLNDETREQNETRRCAYPDVPLDAWYRIEVATLTKMGILKGYPDGTFGGNNETTRAELATILARLSEKDISDEGKTKFRDIKDHWAESEIMTIEDLGWIEGYPDGTFRPNQPITRAETATLMNRVLHRLPEELTDLRPEMIVWPDNIDTSKWYYLAMQEASNSHTYQRLLGTREKWIKILDVIHVGVE